MKIRDYWKKTAKNLATTSHSASQEQAFAWGQFKKFRNCINNRKKYEETLYKAEKMTEVAGSADLLWKRAKSFIGWKSPGTSSQIKVNNELITSARKIAHYMNEYFIEKVTSIRSVMHNMAFPVDKLIDKMSGKICKMQINHIQVNKVRKILKKLSNSKSTAVDELDNFSVKLAADLIVQPLHHIICLSFIQSKFPEKWKYSKVLPLHKKGEKLERKNYRPVSILSPLSKVLEKVVYEQIYDYFSRNSLFHPNLHGYRHNRSTETALIQMYDRWVRAAHSGQLSGVVLLDLSAAFDLVDPNLLLKKLKIYGFDHDSLLWIESYLKNRFMGVWIDHTMSEFRQCPVGVPQGSNLGPLLFLIFYNDLPLSVNCSIDAYADDSTTTVTADSIEDIASNLTDNCKIVSDWMLGNKLKLNAEKTHLMTVGTRARLRNQPSKAVVNMDGLELKESESEMLLGCYVESDLKWHKQVNFLLSKLQTRLGALDKIKHIVQFQFRKTIVESIFTSVLRYCIPVFGGCDKGEIQALQILQNKAARIATLSGMRVRRNYLYDQTGWMTVQQLIYYHTALSTYRIRNSKEPEYLDAILNRNNRSGKIIVPHTNLSLAIGSFCFRASNEWNRLPEELRKCENISSFKNLLRKWILRNVPRFYE